MTKKQKIWLVRILISCAGFITLFLWEHLGHMDDLAWYFRLPIFLVPYLIAGYDVLLRALKNIAHGQVFDENFLMMIATFGAFGIQEYTEAVAVMVFYQVGELFQSVAVSRSRQSSTEMMSIVPEYANIEEGGELNQVDPDDVEIGTIITILPGEKVPLDGVVVEGSSMLNTAALTGESVPRSVKEGDDIISGCVNGSGTLKVRTTKEFDDSTVAKVLELVENASSRKARAENFITRFARYYTPIVTIGAVLLALLPPLITGGEWMTWIARACTFLVISCPCALVISVPLGFFGGIGSASRIGVLIKGSNYLEQTASLHTVVFDKTGTLTLGDFRVSEITPAGSKPHDLTCDDLHSADESVLELLRLAAHAEGYSTHPIAASIRDAFEKEFHFSVSLDIVRDVEELSGKGIRATIEDSVILAGNEKLMAEYGIEYTPATTVGTVIYLADQTREKYLGSLVISDTIKEDTAAALTDLRRAGVTQTVMLTGDHKVIAEKVASTVGIDRVFAELLPADKVDAVETLLAEETPKETLAFVGDGINDAPVLVRSDVGIAMGSLGSDAAIEAADVVIMDDDLKKIGKVIRIARKTVRIVKENIVFALGVKLAILALGALGIAGMWAAVFADVGVAILAILNSMRMLSYRGE